MKQNHDFNSKKQPTIGSRRVPDPLVTLNGQHIASRYDWNRTRRPEVIDLFEEYIYGKPPVHRPTTLRFNLLEVKKGVMDGKATRKQIEILYKGPGGENRFRVLIFSPTPHHKPVPTLLFLNVRDYEVMDPKRLATSEFWPAEYIIDQGYATAVFQVSEVAPDNMEEAYTRVHRVFDEPNEARAPNAWGTIGAWSWAASRVMDYFETDSDIDRHRIGVVGHSRGGKAALWAGAQDERFHLVVSNNSGSTGAAIARDKKGETIAKINSTFPYWFNERYKSYHHREHALPVDQHLLIASIAPRSVYVTSASEDDWADPTSEFLSLVYAMPVYQLFGLGKDISLKQFPPPDSPIHFNGLGYHLRTGEHDLTLTDWKNIIKFWDP